MTVANRPLDHLKDAAGAGKLVTVIGTGCSVALTGGRVPGMTWAGLIKDGFRYARERDKISANQVDFWKNQLTSGDVDDLISAAEFMSRKLEAPHGHLYQRWLQSVFEHVSPARNEMHDAVLRLHQAEIPICTLNYDSLLESVTGTTPITMSETAQVMAWVRRETRSILHLHGLWSAPETCILGIRDYEVALRDEVRDLIQRNLSSFNRLLFIGCGDTFADPNFSALVLWLRKHVKVAGLQHYALVRSADVEARKADPTWQGFVEPISFGDNFEDLPQFLLKHFGVVKRRPARASIDSNSNGRVASYEAILTSYREFLVRDCGQMTIEGIRADMETAQRKFDLERLFVPLLVVAIPPDIPYSDPDRDKKLTEWKANNPKPVPFGEAFQNTTGLAVLALPGGGKTLLLKRIAVAYADPTRREASDDGLPDLQVIPVLIRCREWKEHIRKPIATLLQSISSITGESALEDLHNALESPLRKGNVLLLVDGLDEIHDDADRTIFVENLEKFLNRYPKIRLVVTSREAGFDLVAPCLLRFCARWKIAPLEEPTIRTLCWHWHRLMNGSTPDVEADAEEVTDVLLGNDALRRLAENPLLLTMLLVVKHGAGRLPPDKVSLYERAVEVLLDTWNIKGHNALKIKEAVPQLSCLAYELLRVGKQTATEREMSGLLDDARDRLPEIKRFAKDSSYEFLKRVELRSSLLVESGFTLEDTKTVPFYQFRHLTFQEYLAAVAVTHGYYFNYSKDDTILSPLADVLLSEEWKEVVPMAAVLARKQAAPLLRALVEEGMVERSRLLSEGDKTPIDYSRNIPASISRIIQALVEEAEFATDILSEALDLISLFAQGCSANENWQALSRGPYGEDLIHQAWMLYRSMEWPRRALVRNTVALLEAHSKLPSFWRDPNLVDDILSRLESEDAEELGRTLLLIAGSYWLLRDKSPLTPAKVAEGVERHLFDDRIEIWVAAAWTWGFCRHIQEELDESLALPSSATLSRLVQLFFEALRVGRGSFVAFLLYELSSFPRDGWRLQLDPDQSEWVRRRITDPGPGEEEEFSDISLNTAAIVLAYYGGGIVNDASMKNLLQSGHVTQFQRSRIVGILKHFGLDEDGKVLPKKRSRRKAAGG